MASRGRAPLILTSATYRWEVNSTPRSLYNQKRNLVPTEQVAGGLQSPSGRFGYNKSLCDFDCASSLICGNKMPTRCNRGFYCRSYCLLNMFRAPLCPSSGAREHYTVVAACGISCCGFQVAGLVWSWELCVWFAGCCSILARANLFGEIMYLYVGLGCYFRHAAVSCKPYT